MCNSPMANNRISSLPATDDTGSIDIELFWILSRSLLSASSQSAEIAMDIFLLWYQLEKNGNEREPVALSEDFAQIEKEIERTMEELELAQDALREMQEKADTN